MGPRLRQATPPQKGKDGEPSTRWDAERRLRDASRCSGSAILGMIIEADVPRISFATSRTLRLQGGGRRAGAAMIWLSSQTRQGAGYRLLSWAIQSSFDRPGSI
jgi:hypothetical protein